MRAKHTRVTRAHFVTAALQTALYAASFGNELCPKIMASFCQATATTAVAEAAGLLAFSNPATETLALHQPVARSQDFCFGSNGSAGTLRGARTRCQRALGLEPKSSPQVEVA